MSQDNVNGLRSSHEVRSKFVVMSSQAWGETGLVDYIGSFDGGIRG
jgi:hypothetical protein